MEVTSELSDLVECSQTHNVSYFRQKLIGLPVAKTLVEYKSITRRNGEEEKGPIDIEFTGQNRFWNDEIAIDFWWLDAQEEDDKDIALANYIENLQKQADEEN